MRTGVLAASNVIVVIDATRLEIAVGRVGGELPTTTGIERGELAR